MVGQCKECDFEFDLRKRTCPQCGAKHVPSKQELEEESDFDIQSPAKPPAPGKLDLVEPASPDMERTSEQVKQQLILAEEKRALLTKKRATSEV